jgi:hypothetical protein
MTDITKLLTEGKTYFWALRQVYEDPAAARATLAAAGIDIPTLLALKQLEPSIARFPAPVSARPDPRYLEVPLPPSGNVFFSSLVTEHGVEMGLEIFPEKVSWSFAHRETQIVTGGDTPLDILLVDGSTERKVARPGDISAIPAGTRITFNSSEEGGRFAHAHIFLLNLSNGENRTFYDVVSFLKLQQLDILGSSEGLPPLHEVHHRTEITDWSQLVSPRPGRSVQQPTWLRNGWKNREATRALDYYEGTKSAVVNSPDREPADYLEWGVDVTRCRVNPIIAEHTIAITDCVFPAGYHRSQPGTELWTVLRGQARLSLTMPPLHNETVTRDVSSGTVVVVPGGSRLTVEDASDDLVVRRAAESCAVNGHWRMMEAKLEADGIDREYS